MMRRILLLAAMLATAFARAAVEEGVFPEPGTGNYVVRYVAPADADGPEMTMEGVYYVHTKIQPVLSSIVSANSSTGPAFTYAFSVINGATSVQPLIDVWVPCEGYTGLTQVVSPSGWMATINMNSLEKNVRWGFKDLVERPEEFIKGLPQGARQDGFAFSSALLPGVGTACLSGNAPFETYSTQYLDPRSALGIQINNSLKEIAKNDHVPRLAGLPTFAVPSPFAGAPLLTNIRDHVKNWPQQLLMDPALWQNVDRLLEAAVAALTRNDQVTAASDLAQVRAELRKRYPDLDLNNALDDPRAKDLPVAPDAFRNFLSTHDQRLAANVLDFDVDFVIRKLQVQSSGTPTPPDVDGPAIPMPPESNTTYAPMYDLNGTFTVSWSTPLLVRWFGSATVAKLDHYELEYSRSSNFSNSTKINAGRDLSYQVRNLPKGTYYTRVVPWIGRADNCQGCIGGGSGDQVYDAAPKEPYTGPHETIVLQGPG